MGMDNQWWFQQDQFMNFQANINILKATTITGNTNYTNTSG